MAYKFPSGQVGDLDIICGKVIASKQWSETHISSTGGGGYVAPIVNGNSFGGEIEAPHISSSNTLEREIWLRTDEKVDFRFQGIPAVEGQDVVVVCGNRQGRTSEPLMWINNSSREEGLYQDLSIFYVLSKDEVENRNFTLIKKNVKMLIATIIIFYILCHFSDGGLAVLLFFLGCFFVFIFSYVLIVGYFSDANMKIQMGSLEAGKLSQNLREACKKMKNF